MLEIITTALFLNTIPERMGAVYHSLNKFNTVIAAMESKFLRQSQILTFKIYYSTEQLLENPWMNQAKAILPANTGDIQSNTVLAGKIIDVTSNNVFLQASSNRNK